MAVSRACMRLRCTERFGRALHTQRGSASVAVATALPSRTGSAGDVPLPTAKDVMQAYMQNDELLRQHLMTAPAWSRQELVGVERTHKAPLDRVDKLALATVKTLRACFDVVSGYSVKKNFDALQENDWVRRIIFLETVAGVPGMVAGLIRHLNSCRLMRRDHGWIHTLLAEAENERMHLLIALKLRQPGYLFRFLVSAGQIGFFSFYFLAYLACPRYCHRFVAYLEEEAVHTYSTLLDQMDRGSLPMFSQMKAPKFAVQYYSLEPNAMLRDVFECIRMDESSHRDTNHHLGDLDPTEPNLMLDHLSKQHFSSSQKVQQGNLAAAWKLTEAALLLEFQNLDRNGDGVLSLREFKAWRLFDSLQPSSQDLERIFAQFDTNGDGEVSEAEFLRMMRTIGGFDGSLD